MKKIKENAVRIIMMMLCTVVLGMGLNSCSGYDADSKGGITPPKPTNPEVEDVYELGCNEGTINTFTADNAEIKTRSINVPQGNYEALIKATSVHPFAANIVYKNEAAPSKNDTVRYTVENLVKGYGLKKTRYARSAKVFEKWVEKSEFLSDGRKISSYTFNGESGKEVFALTLIDEQSCNQTEVKIGGKTFTDLCKNTWKGRKLTKVEPIKTTNDSLEYTQYKLILTFQDELLYGTPKAVEYTMTGEKIWIPKEGTNPPIPDDPYEVIAYDLKDKGIIFVKDEDEYSIHNSYATLAKLLSNGQWVNIKKIDVDLKCKVDTADYRIIPVTDFEIKEFEATLAANIPFGEETSRKEFKIRPYTQKFTPRTNKAEFIYDGQTERATYVDSLGTEHMMLYPEYQFVDQGSKAYDMDKQENKERKLLVSSINTYLNKQEKPYRASVELQKLEEGTKRTAIDVINERTKLKDDKWGIEFDLVTKYNNQDNDTTFNMFFDPEDRLVEENIILVNNRNYKQSGEVPEINKISSSKFENGMFSGDENRYSNVFSYVGFNNNMTAFLKENVIVTVEGLSTDLKMPARKVNFIRFGKSEKNEGDDKLQIYTDSIKYNMTAQYPEKGEIIALTATQLLRAKINVNDPTDPKAIRYRYDEFGMDAIDKNISYTYCNKYAIYTDGTEKLLGKVGVNMNNYVEAPTLDPIQVPNFNIQTLTPASGNDVEDGTSRTDGNFALTGYKKAFVTKTEKSNQEFWGHSERAIYTDEFGQTIEMLYKSYEFAEISYNFSSLTADGNNERKLYTSNITATYMLPETAKAEVIFFTVNGGGGNDKDIMSYEYSNKGLRFVDFTTNFAYMTKTPVYADGSKGTSVEIGKNIKNRVVAATYNPIDVKDFNVTDGQPSTGSKVKSGENREEDGFKFTGYKITYTTRTNKNPFEFTGYTEEVVYVDEFGHEEPLMHSDYSFADKGSKTTDLDEESGYERKLSTSTISATYNDKAKDHQSEIILRKKAAKTLKNVEYGDNGISFKSGNTWTAWQNYTKVYSDGSRVENRKEVDLLYIINAQASKEVKNDTPESAVFQNIASGNATTSTRSGGENIEVTINSKVWTEDYAIFNDTYTEISETAAYSDVEDGIDIKFNFPSVKIENVQHNSDNVVNSNTIKKVGDIVYDIYNHDGSIAYSVDGQNFTSTCYTAILKAQKNDPETPSEWGKIVSFGSWTKVFNKQLQKFEDCFVVNFEKGKLVVINSRWNASSSFFDWSVCYNDNRVRSAVQMDNGKYFPSVLQVDGTGWNYLGENKNGETYKCAMSDQLAIHCGIKNFVDNNDAKPTPEVRHYADIINGTLYVYNAQNIVIYKLTGN